MLLDLILSLGVRRRHTPVFLNTPPCYSYRMASLEAAARAAPAARRFLETSRMLVRGGHPLRG